MSNTAINNYTNKITFNAILLLFILMVAIANRFYGLDRLSLWADELWVVMASSKGSLLDMFSFIQYHDNHPPGHYFFTRYWQMLFGDSDYTIRFPFAVAGVFLVYSTYVIGREHYSAAAGLIGAALISSAWQAIYYSQEARANIMVAVAALWSLNYFYRVVFSDQIDKKNLLGFWVTATLCAYLHYVGTVYVASLALVFFCLLLLLRRRQAFFVLGLKLFLPVLVLFSPWLPSMYYHLTHTPPGAWWSVPEWNYFYNNFIWIFWFGGKVFILYQGAFILLCITLILYMMSSKKINAAIARAMVIPEPEVVRILQFSSLILLMTAIPPIIFFIKSKISQPVYDYRHFIYTMPFMAMAAGFMVSLFFMRFRRWIGNTILVLIVVFIIAIQNLSNMFGKLYTGPHGKSEYRQTVSILLNDQRIGEPSTAIIANIYFFNHYLQRFLAGRTADFIVMDIPQANAASEQMNAKKVETIYFLETPDRSGNGMISMLDMELAKRYQPLCRTHFVYAQIIKFSKDAPKEVNWDHLPDCN